jgi:hypothetical protein
VAVQEGLRVQVQEVQVVQAEVVVKVSLPVQVFQDKVTLVQ